MDESTTQAWVFPNGGRWEKENLGLYAQMRQVLQAAKEDNKVLEEK